MTSRLRSTIDDVECEVSLNVDPFDGRHHPLVAVSVQRKEHFDFIGPWEPPLRFVMGVDQSRAVGALMQAMGSRR